MMEPNGRIAGPMIVIIDNYDSFTYNLAHYIGELGARIEVIRNDAATPEEVLARKPDAIVMSPGPCTPNEAGICLDLIAKAAHAVPLLGVCLGHQSIGQAFGASVVRAPALMHGKTSRVSHSGQGLFDQIPQDFIATRYHSLTIAPETIPQSLTVTARADDGVIMGVQHESLPIHGVQFHPESIASEHGHDLLRNFLTLADHWNAAHRAAA